MHEGTNQVQIDMIHIELLMPQYVGELKFYFTFMEHLLKTNFMYFTGMHVKQKNNIHIFMVNFHKETSVTV